MTCPRNSARPLLLGHRGARALKSIPENTVASFEQALADGCDGFEFDVRLTADGKAVVCHDPQIGGIEIARVPAQQVAGLPHLQDVFARYQERAFLDIELKVLGLEKITLDLLRKHPPRRGYVVSSFVPKVLQGVYAVDPTVPLGLICETGSQLRLWNELPIGYLIPHRRLVGPALIRDIKATSKKILVWTVNAPAEMKRLANAGVEGIISDKPSLLCQTLTG